MGMSMVGARVRAAEVQVLPGAGNAANSGCAAVVKEPGVCGLLIVQGLALVHRWFTIWVIFL